MSRYGVQFGSDGKVKTKTDATGKTGIVIAKAGDPCCCAPGLCYRIDLTDVRIWFAVNATGEPWFPNYKVAQVASFSNVSILYNPDPAAVNSPTVTWWVSSYQPSIWVARWRYWSVYPWNNYYVGGCYFCFGAHMMPSNYFGISIGFTGQNPGDVNLVTPPAFEWYAPKNTYPIYDGETFAIRDYLGAGEPIGGDWNTGKFSSPYTGDGSDIASTYGQGGWVSIGRVRVTPGANCDVIPLVAGPGAGDCSLPSPCVGNCGNFSVVISGAGRFDGVFSVLQGFPPTCDWVRNTGAITVRLSGFGTPTGTWTLTVGDTGGLVAVAWTATGGRCPGGRRFSLSSNGLGGTPTATVG